MRKNEPGQTLRVFAFNHLSGQPATGDAGNITCTVRLDGGLPRPLEQLHPVEQENGYYYFDLTSEETNGDVLDFTPVSSTSQVVVICPHFDRDTRPAMVSVEDLLMANKYIDQSAVPWKEVLVKRGTGNLATGVRLLERELFTIDGKPVDSISKFVASAIEPGS